METRYVLDQIEPEVEQRLVSRRDALVKTGKFGLALASAPVAISLLANKAFGQALPQQIVSVLNFALTLEYLEDEFYRKGLSTTGLILPADRAIFEQISKHETAHVALLKGVLGSQAVAKPTFDFTAGGNFKPFSDYAQFRLLAQAFEDTGVRAYKGQATALMSNNDILTTALRIHSVEARHASEVRRLNGSQGWIPLDQAPIAAVAAVYAGEANTTHAGVDAQTVTQVPREPLTEAFDEPLTMQQVLAIADPFIV